MKTILLINLIIGYVTIFGVLLIGGSIMTLKHFPTSKVSNFIRRHLITDEDLEPMNKSSPPNNSYTFLMEVLIM